MSGFLDITPSVQIALENPLLGRIYPYDDGSVNAIIDSGYEGFVLVPKSVFQKLELNRLQGERRSLALANGTPSKTQGTFAVLLIPHLSLKMDGFVETLRGVDEIIVGVEALVRMNVLLDYCTKSIRLQKCP
ncbi:MAG: clan AA aspartic protease [archaeon]|nr:clan AA aspartic protease [archaeon]